jgi:hypothetical protein
MNNLFYDPVNSREKRVFAALHASNVRSFGPTANQRAGVSRENRMTDSLEVFINEQRADIELHRILLMMFFARIIGANPVGAEERLQDLKTSTMGVVAKAAALSPEDTRMPDMLKDRAEKFLSELEAIVFQARAKVDGTPRN